MIARPDSTLVLARFVEEEPTAMNKKLFVVCLVITSTSRRKSVNVHGKPLSPTIQIGRMDLRKAFDLINHLEAW